MAASNTISGGTFNINEIVFSEFQARVFNQTEAAYRVNGYLNTPLFEDSYLLSKATAEYIITNVGVSGQPSAVNTVAMDVYRAVLGIVPTTPPPPPPGPVGATGGVSPNAGGGVSPQSGFAATTPTSFTPATNNSGGGAPTSTGGNGGFGAGGPGLGSGGFNPDFGSDGFSGGGIGGGGPI